MTGAPRSWSLSTTEARAAGFCVRDEGFFQHCTGQDMKSFRLPILYRRFLLRKDNQFQMLLTLSFQGGHNVVIHTWVRFRGFDWLSLRGTYC
jgi:hypothetical protein